MLNILYRMAIAAFCFVALLYIVPLFLAVLKISVQGPLWQLLQALAAVAAIAYVIWGPHRWPWGNPPA